jgi:hypothetical protein
MLIEGGKCGSTTIDRAFHDLLRARFGRAFDNAPRRSKEIGSRLMRDFEDAKKDFGSTTRSRNWRFPLQMNGVNSEHYEDGEVKIST